MDGFINVNRRDPKVKTKIKVFSDKYNRLPHINQSKRVYDTLILYVILKEKINLTGATIVDLDTELKIEISRKKYLEKIIMIK